MISMIKNTTMKVMIKVMMKNMTINMTMMIEVEDDDNLTSRQKNIAVEN